MGSPASEEGRSDDEGPQHRVTIGSPFAVGVYEVTFDEWEACVRGGGCEDIGYEDWGRGTHPMINVSWDDAQGYVRWLSRETGQRYRLLSEAEWEYVARAGTGTARYWGDSAAAQCRYANGADAAHVPWRQEIDSLYDSSYAARCSDGYGYTAPVGSYEPNAFGLHDILGNVWEWTDDCWNGSYAGAPADGSAWRSGDCSQRVLRGGSWNLGPVDLRSASRFGLLAGGRVSYGGFRVARTKN